MTQRLRLITIAWGERYINQLLCLTLPAVLAPRNLPALVEAFDCEFVLVTQESYFEQVRNSKVFQNLQEYCPARLVMVDDLIGDPGKSYGMSLTFAFHRGFSDLGADMTGYFLIFFNADFILGDGSMEMLSRRMLAGERLIFAPSYCVSLEDVLPLLKSRVDEEVHSLTIPLRELAALALTYRHNTIRAKTINQRLFHLPYMEQFYWHVDENTLLGHQMPISLVCMKPERVLTTLSTFWDYGIVSEACPTYKPCVLGDSDDFLMIELRPQWTALEQLSLGWPTAEKVAATLSGFVTKDQRDLGRYSLVLHSRNLPESTEQARVQLSKFVNRVYELMPEKPVHHLNHMYWIREYGRFRRAREKYLKNKVAAVEAIASQSGTFGEEGERSYKGFFGRLLRSIPLCLEGIHARIFGRFPVVNRLHPYHAILRPALEAVAPELMRPRCRVLLVATSTGPISNYVKLQADELHSTTDGYKVLQETSLSPPGAATAEAPPSEECVRTPVDLSGPFDLCVCEVNYVQLSTLGNILQRIRPLMGPRGRILIFHLNIPARDLRAVEREIILKSTLPVGHSQITFAGSMWTKWALNLYNVGTTIRNHYPGVGSLALAALVLLAVPFSMIGNWSSERQPQHIWPRSCLSLTMEYRLS